MQGRKRQVGRSESGGWNARGVLPVVLVFSVCGSVREVNKEGVGERSRVDRVQCYSVAERLELDLGTRVWCVRVCGCGRGRGRGCGCGCGCGCSRGRGRGCGRGRGRGCG
eukprot:4207637-Pleurochrysis_carterae.AAC.1